MLCCVACSCLDIKAVFLLIVECLLALHYITFLFFALRTVYYTCYARSRPNYNRHASSVTKFLLESTTGLWMLAGCLLSSSPRPCKPCALCSFGWGSHRLPFSVFPHHPSWTCGGEKSPVCCGMLKFESLRDAQALGVGGGPLAVLLRGGFGRSPVVAVASTTLGFAIRNPGDLLGGKPEAHLFVGVQHRRRDERLFQASSTAVTHIVMRDYYVIQVGEVISPHISTEGAEG